VVTEILPVEPESTTSVILVSEFTLKVAALLPLKVTEVAPVKFFPNMFMVAPEQAMEGLKDVMVGGAYLKPSILSEPFGVVTITLPLLQLLNVANMVLSFFTLKL
jgi:hypothetical protein